MTPFLDEDVEVSNGISYTELYIINDAVNIDNKIRIKTMPLTIKDIRDLIADPKTTPESLADQISSYLNEAALSAEEKMSPVIANDTILLTSIIAMIKESETLTDEFKSKVLCRLGAQISDLEEAITEIHQADKERVEYEEKENRKEKFMNKYGNIFKVSLAITAVAFTAFVGYKAYRKYNPSLEVVDLSDISFAEVE